MSDPIIADPAAQLPQLPQLSEDVKAAAMRLSRRLRAEHPEGEVSPGQFTVLLIIAKRGPLSVGQLSELERVSPPSMNRTINYLADGGYVERISTPEDGRVVLVRATAEGEALVRETQLRRNTWLAARLEELSDEERDVLHRASVIMRRIAAQ